MNKVDFDHLFSALPSPHMVLDRELRFVAANPAYEAAVMRSRADLIGLKLFDLFPNEGESGQRLLASLRRVFETGNRDTLAYIRYEIPRPEAAGGEMEERYWTAIHSPLLAEDGEVQYVLQNTVDITELVRLREAASVPFRIIPAEIELVQRAREAEEASRASRWAGSDFKRLFQQSPGMIAVLQGPRHVFTFANDTYLRFVGHRDIMGRPIREALPDIEGQGFYEMLDQVFETGVVQGGDSVRVVIRRLPDGSREETFLDFSYSPIHDAEGVITGVLVQANDRTESVRADQRQRLLIDELNHRVKNTLSAVQSIARQSFRDAEGQPAARHAFEARILALSNAHNLLSERHWESADFGDILRQEVMILDPGRIVMDGPAVRLNPKSAIALAMVLHEMATNALKYGAMAAPDGCLDVRWSRSEPERPAAEERLVLDWIERFAPPEAARLAQGFGIRMLERIVEGELEGGLDMDLGDGGLTCRIDVPLLGVEDVGSDAAA